LWANSTESEDVDANFFDVLAAVVVKLKEQLAEITKQKSRKRRRIQQGGTIKYRTAAAQIATKASAAPQRSKKARGGGD